jgi:ubiquinone biosynthesis protein
LFRSNLRRMAHIFSVLIKHALALAIDKQPLRWPRLVRRLPIGLSGPARLRAVIEEIGGTFIKFGQMLALQPDVLPLEYCNALFDLLDRIEPFEIGQVEGIFIEEFGKSPSEIFDSFDPHPIATASIGQVHIAYLGGRKLAVKVQRPTVETDFAGDIRLMTAAIRLIKRMRLKGLYWMVEPTSEFIAWTGEELDYRHEARYMEQHRSNARHNPSECVPAVLSQYTTRRTLVAEYIEGVTVLDYIRALETGDEMTLRKLKASGFDPNQFVCNILDNFLGDAYRYGMFHADLHPANLKVMPRNVIGYVDFGITGVLSRRSRQNLVALTLGLGRGDLEAMCATFFQISAMDANSDPERFREGIKRLADDWYEGHGNDRRLTRNATHVMFEMLQLSRRTGIYPERDVVKYIRSAIAIDGLITRAAPGFDLGQHLEMICNHYLKWQARRALFSYNTLVDWTNSSGHLMRDGAFRAASFVRRVAAGELRASAEIDQSNRDAEGPLRLRALLLGGILLVVSLLITATGERVQVGVNLFTAEAMLIAVATFRFLQAIRGLIEGR